MKNLFFSLIVFTLASTSVFAESPSDSVWVKKVFAGEVYYHGQQKVN